MNRSFIAGSMMFLSMIACGGTPEGALAVDGAEELLSSAASYSGTLSSSFTSSNENWRLNYFNQDSSTPATWDGKGAIAVTDYTDGLTYQFTAPWTGNLSNYANATLTFSIKDVPVPGGTGSGAKVGNSQAIQLISKDWSTVLNWPITASAAPGQSYTTYTLKFAADGKWWKTGTNALATSADFRKVLSNLGYLRIVAEYIDGNDTCSLDSVSITPTTTTASIGGSSNEGI